MKLLSVIVPCYNEEENVADFYNEFMSIKYQNRAEFLYGFRRFVVVSVIINGKMIRSHLVENSPVFLFEFLERRIRDQNVFHESERSRDSGGLRLGPFPAVPNKPFAVRRGFVEKALRGTRPVKTRIIKPAQFCRCAREFLRRGRHVEQGHGKIRLEFLCIVDQQLKIFQHQRVHIGNGGIFTEPFQDAGTAVDHFDRFRFIEHESIQIETPEHGPNVIQREIQKFRTHQGCRGR